MIFNLKKKKTYLFLIKIKNKKLKFKNFSPTKPLKTIIWEIKLYFYEKKKKKNHEA